MVGIDLEGEDFQGERSTQLFHDFGVGQHAGEVWITRGRRIIVKTHHFEQLDGITIGTLHSDGIANTQVDRGHLEFRVEDDQVRASILYL